ncbi:MAG: flippase, partial [Bacteroidetes bacterium]
MIGDKKYWIRSGLLTFLERLSGLALGFGTAILLFRQLTHSEFGVWVLFLTVVAILEVGRAGLLQNALVKYLSTAKSEGEYRAVMTASWALHGLLALLLCGVFLAFAQTLARFLDAPTMGGLFEIYALTTVVLTFFFQFNFVQQANLDFRGIFWSNLVRQGTLFGFVLQQFLSGDRIWLPELAWAQLAGAVLGGLTGLVFAAPYLRFGFPVRWSWVGRLFGFGKYVLGTNLSTMVYKSIDKMMLGTLPGVGPAAVALYEAAIKVSNLADVPTLAMASVVFPKSARSSGDGNGNGQVRLLYEKSVGASLALLLPAVVLVWVFAEPVVLLLAGPQYADAAPVLRVTIFFGLFMPFAVLFGTVLDSIGKPRINFWFTLGGMALNVVSNYFFILRFGVMGAAYGTLLTYAVA